MQKVSRGNFALTTGHYVCSLHFEAGTKTYMNNVPVVFFGKIPPLRPAPKIIYTARSTSSQETQPSVCESALNTMLTDKSKAECDGTQEQIERLQEELQKVLRLQRSLKHQLAVFKFGLSRLKDSEKNMCYYIGLTGGQFVELFNFLNAHGLNYWGS